MAAFILSVWWTVKKGAEKGEMPSAGVIWERFPNPTFSTRIEIRIFYGSKDEKVSLFQRVRVSKWL
jgi:hypothetical protein